MVSGWFKADAAGRACPRRTRRQASRAPSTGFLAGLTVSPIRNSRLVDVRFESPDAGAGGAGRQRAGARRTSSRASSSSSWRRRKRRTGSGERLGEQRKQVEASEQALQHYREQTDAVSLEDKQNIVVQKLADLNARGDAGEDRADSEGGALQPARVAPGRSGGARHVSGDPHRTPSSSSRRASWRSCSGSRRSCRDKLGPQPSRHGEAAARRSRPPRRSSRARSARSCSRRRTSTRRRWRRSTAWSNALEQQKRDALAMNRKGIDYGVLAARRHEQPPDLRQPDAADQGNRHLRAS